MAVKIEIEGDIKKIKPKNIIFDDISLIEIFPNGYQFIDMGLFIVIINDSSVISKMNKIASLFLRYPVYGEILMVSGKELNKNIFKIVTKENTKFNQNDFDEGIVNLLKETIMTFKIITSADENVKGQQFNIATNEFYDKKQILALNPNKLRESSQDEEDKKFIIEFYAQAFEQLKIKPKNLQDIILYDDPFYLIQFTEGRVIETLEIMVEYFIEKEEFEKCAVLRDIIKENKEIDKKYEKTI